MAILCPLFSGSSGNCTYISYRDKYILIDAGVSCKKIVDTITNIGGNPNNISALFITHEHIDHIKGMKAFLKKFPAPIYCSKGTADALHILHPDQEGIFDFEEYVSQGGFEVKRFQTSHDCPGSSGYRIITPDNKKIAVCTDLGYVSEEVDSNLSGCDVVMIEANHELSMLKTGPYPYELKRRIMSDEGHLSNACCAEEISRLIKTGCRRFVAAHLSKENNHPIIAAQSIESALELEGYIRDEDYILEVAPPVGGKIMVI